MNTEPTQPGSLSRRTLGKRVAWSTPIILAATAVPAFAASQAPVMDASGYVRFNRGFTGTGTDGQNRLRVHTVGAASDDVAPGYAVLHTTTSSVISNYSTTFWFASAGLDFDPYFLSDGGWTLLEFDPDMPTQQRAGIVYYPYTTTYVAPVTATDGVTMLPLFAFETSDSVLGLLADLNYFGSPQLYFYNYSSVVVDGVLLERGVGPIGIFS